MAAKGSIVESFLNCHVCKETFRDPVSLSCSHSFCSDCLKQCWERANNKNCPICKRKSSKGIIVNIALKALADSFAEGQKEEKVEFVCKHQERIWFCEDEQRAYCHECESSLHKSHKVVPIQQAVRGLKEELRADLQALQDKTDKLKQAERAYSGVVTHSNQQVADAEMQIKDKFRRLQEELMKEEESRLAALRAEEEQKRKTVHSEMKMIQDQISCLSGSISAVEEELHKEDNLSFLSSYKDTQTAARVHSSVPDPRPISGALIDVAKYLDDLPCIGSKKNKDKVLTSPFILDPNTAHPLLCLSDDLTSVRLGDTEQQLPDNPERFTLNAIVLGSEGFSSGKHTWQVEVGGNPDWRIGVAKESVDRKGSIYASPKDGIWSLTYKYGRYSDVVDETISVKKSPQRIRVQLDYGRGEVSFYDSEDKSLICSHTDTFTENLFPYFSVGWAGDDKIAEIKICPSEIFDGWW